MFSSASGTNTRSRLLPCPIAIRLLNFVPLAITVWLVWAMGSWLDAMGDQAVKSFRKDVDLPTGVGAATIIVAIYLVGLLTRVWVFRSAYSLIERLLGRVPGVKTIYESLRDMMKLFGGDAEKMGRVVKYTPPGPELSLLGIMTNKRPVGIADGTGQSKVAVYLPYAYMFGGPTIYVSPEYVEEVDLSVDQCLKIAATAHVGAEAPPAGGATESPSPGNR